MSKQNDSARLRDDIALVTGASKGIGRAIAVSLAEQGADLIVNYPNDSEAENANQTAQKSRETAPEHIDTTVLTNKADVSEVEDIDRMFAEAEQALGSVSVLVNNAGVFSTSPVTDISTEEWDRVLDINLRGSFLTIRRALDPMLEAKSGSIINIASELAYIGDTNVSHYAASKGGIVSMTRAIAREAAPDVRVNAIAPGPISTDLLQQTPQEQLEEQLEIPAERAGKPEEVAPTAVFLASDDASYYYGQVLSPSGGAAML